jgi:outer membrane protein assembly factor BamA
LPFDPQHLLVGQIGMGISGGIEGSAEIPAQQQFTLGGVNSLRGFPFSDARLVGRNEIEFNAEYRHSWVNDLDWNFFEIARLRKIQGVLFADAGRVTDSIADEINTGSPPTGYDLEGLVDFSEYFSDVGYGLRFYVDALGIRNTLIRFDAATPTSPNAELDPVYYMSLTQAF